VGYVKSVFALVLIGDKRRWSGWDGMDGKTYYFWKNYFLICVLSVLLRPYHLP